ncbi:MAG: sensor histidine kinase [Firmicutes bacterium]|nr:sensor histidine kinase [Bacillota bacterium]
MESNQNRVTSITRRIHRAWVFSKIRYYIGMDFLLVFLLFFGSLLEKEISRFGTFSLDTERKFGIIKDFPYFDYQVMNLSTEKMVHFPLKGILVVIVAALSLIILSQILNLVFSYGKEHRKIRKILAPIDEIALKAEELSKLSFNEEKYHVIEDAITHMEANDDQLLEFHDRDLQGVETAMNNLLVSMRESYRQQARFVNDASHELRTPIAVIEGYVNMIARWGKKDEKVLDESIEALQKESAHMKRLVEQLLFLARGDAGRNKFDIEEVSLKECMQEIYEESLMIDEDHVYRYHPEMDIIVQADPTMLKQAVRILVDNAAKYTKKDDDILLSIGKDEKGRAYLQVQDTGIGMIEADVEHMFERFYRSDEARKYKGTGLGLSIAKWIVDKHKGHFEILSRPGLGTRIRIVLS